MKKFEGSYHSLEEKNFWDYTAHNYDSLSLFKMQYLVMKTAKIVFFWFKWNHAIYCIRLDK